MNKRRVWFGLMAVAVVLTALACWPHRAPEPTYQGRNLSDWLQRLDTPSLSPMQRSEAEAAIRAIGTNASPYLLERLSERPSRARQFLTEVGNELFVDVLPLRRSHWETPTARRVREASWGFEALGVSASNAFPALAVLMDRPIPSRLWAARWLYTLGLPAAPTLLPALTNRHETVRYIACQALHDLLTNHPESADLAAPALLNSLRETNTVDGRPIRYVAIQALGQMRSRAGDATTALTYLLADADPTVRVLALQSLHDLGTQAKSSQLAVINAGSDPDPKVRQAATNALQAITAPEGGTEMLH